MVKVRNGLVGVVMALGLSTTAMAAPKAPPPELAKAAEARIALADQRIKLLEKTFARGGTSIEQMLNAYHQWMVANRESAPSAAKLVEAATTYRDRNAKLVELTELRFKNGDIAEPDLVAARYGLAEAEYWLQEAKWKASGN